MNFTVARFALASFVPLLLSFTAGAVTVDTAIMTKDGWSECTAPTPTSIVTNTDDHIRLWFTVTDLHIGDVGSVEWYDPSGQLKKSGSYQPANTDGRSCYGDELPITNQSRQLGAWVVKILWNRVIHRTITFTIGPVIVRGPDVSVKWVSSPPVSLTSGQVFNVSFGIQGDTTISYRIHSGANPDPSTYPDVQSSWIDAAAGTIQASLKAPVVTSPTAYYYVVHASVGKLDYFSLVAKSIVSPSGSVGGGSPTVQWTQKPPTTFNNGDSIAIQWQISGGSLAMYSHVHLALDQASLKTSNSIRTDTSQNTGSDGLHNLSFIPTDSSLLGSLPSGTVVYMLVHASDPNGTVNYWTSDDNVATSTVSTPATSSNTEPCLVFVHGSRDADADPDYMWSLDWMAGRNYWREYSPYDVGWGGPAQTLTNSAEDFVRIATNNLTRPHFVVRYNGAAAWWDDTAAARVAQEIVRATNGEYDAINSGVNRADRSRCERPYAEGGRFIVITHSMGATVMDFILGNAKPSDSHYNWSGAPFNVVADRISGVVSVGGAHRGTALADLICGSASGCNIVNGQRCTDARYWLQTGHDFQVSTYSNSPAKPVWLIGGNKGLPTSGCLDGEDDGVLELSSQLACKSSIGVEISNACDSKHKMQDNNFINIDTVYETHDDEKNGRGVGDRTRRSLPDGIWKCDGNRCAPNTVVHSNLSSAAMVDLLISAKAIP